MRGIYERGSDVTNLLLQVEGLKEANAKSEQFANDQDRLYRRDLVRAALQGEIACQGQEYYSGEYVPKLAERVCDLADAVLAEVKRREKGSE